MIMKIVIEDQVEEVYEIGHYYTEPDYLEVAMGNSTEAGDREMIVSEGGLFINMEVGAEEGETGWEKIVVMTDSGVELLTIENLEVE